MRRAFAENLDWYNEIAKAQMNENLSAEEDADLKGAKNFAIKRASEKRLTTEKAQEQIFDFQVRKQEIMKQLKIDIENLDNPDFIPERKNGSHRIVFENGKYFWRGAVEGKPNIEVSLGDIMTDGEWGLLYYLDQKSVPRNIRKKYLIECSKRELRQLLDMQIARDESDSKKNHIFKREAYIRTVQESERSRGGVVVEKIVRNIFAKLMYDHGSSFQLIESDIFQDIEKKIDFVIHRKTHYRGVGVEESNNVKEVAVQFTLKTDAETLAHKEHQVEETRRRIEEAHQRKELRNEKNKKKTGLEDRISDIILVSVPVTFSFTTLYKEWINNPTCGGPEKLLDPEIKKQFIRKILTGIVPEKEIAELEQMVG